MKRVEPIGIEAMKNAPGTSTSTIMTPERKGEIYKDARRECALHNNRSHFFFVSQRKND